MKKIISLEQVQQLSKGDKLYFKGEKETLDYSVMAINEKGIMLIHEDGVTLARIYPLELLIDTHWYVPF